MAADDDEHVEEEGEEKVDTPGKSALMLVRTIDWVVLDVCCKGKRADMLRFNLT